MITNIRLGFTKNGIVLLAVTKIIIEKHCDKVLLRSHMLTVLSSLKTKPMFCEPLFVVYVSKTKCLNCKSGHGTCITNSINAMFQVSLQINKVLLYNKK